MTEKKVSSIKELKKRHNVLCDRLLDYIIKDDTGESRGIELLHDILCADDDFEAGVRERIKELEQIHRIQSDYYWREEIMELRRILSVRTPLTKEDKT